MCESKAHVFCFTVIGTSTVRQSSMHVESIYYVRVHEGGEMKKKNRDFIIFLKRWSGRGEKGGGLR